MKRFQSAFAAPSGFTFSVRDAKSASPERIETTGQTAGKAKATAASQRAKTAYMTDRAA